MPRSETADLAPAAAILEAYREAQEARDETLSAAARACEAALRCGDLLIREKEKHKNEWLLWLKCNCPEICQSTAKNYMRIAKIRQSLGGAAVDLQTLRAFYLLAGILPPHTPAPRNSASQILQFWSFATKINHWLPELPASQNGRLKDWWESIGRTRGWL